MEFTPFLINGKPLTKPIPASSPTPSECPNSNSSKVKSVQENSLIRKNVNRRKRIKKVAKKTPKIQNPMKNNKKSKRPKSKDKDNAKNSSPNFLKKNNSTTLLKTFIDLPSSNSRKIQQMLSSRETIASFSSKDCSKARATGFTFTNSLLYLKKSWPKWEKANQKHWTTLMTLTLW